MASGSAGGSDTFDDRLCAAAAAVAEARRRVERGSTGGTEALAVLVSGLLREADAASATRPAGTRALLVALLDEVQALLEAIEFERAAAGMRLKELAARGRAGQAYGARR